ncbi:hypothetical protein GCM10022409_31090 [Hymenobacter glaciei]|uniref:Secretion system C-terminal sorting domain-containing protein n=1 Tax=Hymenobacter glaciei TaxID=877209 RepID=A0ABP7UGK5_9BACT
MLKNDYSRALRWGHMGWLALALLALLTLPGSTARAQAPAFTQATSFGFQAGGGSISGDKLAADAQGNVYVTGTYAGDIDFGSIHLSGDGGFVAKRGPTGNWLWALRIEKGGNFDSQNTDIAVDDNGYPYVLGNLPAAGAQFGSTTLALTGVFVAKLDPAGTWLWAVAGGSRTALGNCTGTSLAVQGNGSALAITGRFAGSVSFGSLAVATTSPNNTDAFVARLDGAGNWLWVQRGGGSQYDQGRTVALDAGGNVFCTGDYSSSTATFGTTALPLTPAGGIVVAPSDIFVVRLDAAGNWLWALSVGSNDIDTAVGLAVGSDGNAYVAGNYQGSMVTLGSTTLSHRNFNGQPSNELFVAKLTPAGTWLWATRAGGAYGAMGISQAVDLVGMDLAVDAANNPCVTGSLQVGANVGTSATAYFGTNTLLATLSIDLFVARLTAAGTWQWALKATGTGTDRGRGIASSSTGTVYVAGDFASNQLTLGSSVLTLGGTTDLVLAELSSSGTVQRVATTRGRGESEASALASDAAGNTYVVGNFRSEITLGTTTLRSLGDRDIVVAKRAPDGHYLWAVRAGGTENDRSHGIAVDGSGNVYITGEYHSFTAGFGSTNLTGGVANSFTEANVFVAKLDAQGNWLWATQAGGSGYLNDDISNGIAVDGSGNACITGYFQGASATFGSTTLTNRSGATTRGSNLFVAKLAPGGSWLWAVSGGSVGTTAIADHGAAVAVDGSGNVSVTGAFSRATAVFGSITLSSTNAPSNSSREAFVAQLSPAGSWQWAVQAGGPRDDFGTGLAVDGSGSVYVSGSINQTITSTSTAYFGTIPLVAATGHAFAARLSPAGSWQWAVQAGGTNYYDLGGPIAVDGSGNAYLVAGVGSTDLTFGSIHPTTTHLGELAVAKIDPAGTFLWVVLGSALNTNGNGIVNGAGLTVTSSGILYLVSTFYGPQASFGPFSVVGSGSYVGYTGIHGRTGYIAQLGGTVTGTLPGLAARRVALWPNPTRETVQVSGFAPGQAVRVLDALGRVVLRATVPAAGPLLLHLPATLRAGIYLVQASGQQARLQVE